MHFLTSLMILSGFLFVLGVGLVNLIRNLSEMSIHVSPHMQSTPHSPAGEVGEPHTNTTAHELNPAEVSEAA